MDRERLKEKWRKIRKELRVLSLAIRHPRTPRAARWILVAVVGYALSPVDLVPDFIPGLGQLDDIILIPLGIWIAYRMIPKDVILECREEVEKEFSRQEHL